MGMVCRMAKAVLHGDGMWHGEGMLHGVGMLHGEAV